MIEFPLETERLLLRPLETDDEDALHEIWSHPSTREFTGGTPWSRRATRDRLAAKMAHQRDHGYSMWAVVERYSGRVVGECGLQRLEGGPEVEVGWRVHPDLRRRGYATEAARAALDAGFGTLGLDRIVAVTDPENVASRRVMEKLGMTFEGPGRHYGDVTVVYATGGSG